MAISLSNNNPAVLPEDTSHSGASPSITLVDTNGKDYSLTADGDNLTILSDSTPTTVVVGGTGNTPVVKAGGDVSLYVDGGTGASVVIRPSAGTVNAIDCNPASVVVNEGGANMDFRVEGDTDTALFCCDASTDRVGIGTSGPSFKFEVSDNTSGLPAASISNGHASGRGLLVSSPDAGSYQLNVTTEIGSERFKVAGGAVIVPGNNFQIATAKTPASASDTGTTGQIAWDANYVYVCVATDTWKRAAIATW